MNSRTDSNEFQGAVRSKAAKMRYLHCDSWEREILRPRREHGDMSIDTEKHISAIQDVAFRRTQLLTNVHI